jgi:hypothetical protein
MGGDNGVGRLALQKRSKQYDMAKAPLRKHLHTPKETPEPRLTRRMTKVRTGTRLHTRRLTSRFYKN